jgi:hypothetical protein
VDESEAVLRRLERIEQLDRSGAPVTDLVEELRGLVSDAEVWSRREGGDDGERAVESLRQALAPAQALNVRAHVPDARVNP